MAAADSVIRRTHQLTVKGKAYDIPDPDWPTLCDAQEAFERAKGSMRGTICYAYAVAREAPEFRGDFKTLEAFMAADSGMKAFEQCIEPFVLSVMGKDEEGGKRPTADEFQEADVQAR